MEIQVGKVRTQHSLGTGENRHKTRRWGGISLEPNLPWIPTNSIPCHANKQALVWKSLTYLEQEIDVSLQRGHLAWKEGVLSCSLRKKVELGFLFL